MDRLDDLTDPQFEDFLSSLYLTMLRLGRPTRGALVESGLHPDDVTRAAMFLEGRGLITRHSEGVWDIVPPETAMPRRAAELEARARSTRSTANELGALWRASRNDPGEPHYAGVDMLRSVDQVVLATYSLTATAEHHIRAFMDASPAALRLLLEQDRPISRPKVPSSAISLVVDVALFAHDGLLGRLEALAGSGQRIAVGDGLPFSGLVVDDSAALVDLSRHDARADGSFVTRRPAPVAALGALFQSAFDLSTPLGSTSARTVDGTDQPPLLERDRRVLSLLATGATDQQIARSLSVSTRTVERRVAILMRGLGAATRFQAGVQAARRDWI
ncbi:LuxR C-terminal-related transcriptional regulator [Ornithinimicrobium sp. F0845]|uniref:helix-turn-helix transcriptional regulator n=1 Tax=Ornithinimicrobium sp. F0845 TaxID=2926412 RepID=UPI001FF36F29|nr:helix-turn-helix transcriptional regulator [Ornithinimicrobium sp. F0845]MCK0113039.1 LuxR C-terminal-related transcriptional regulator [Ornithinimicrobium sp. F0845]